MPNILEHLFCKTRPGDCFCQISFCLSRQTQPLKVTIKLVFFAFYFKVSEYPFQQNKNMLKNTTVLLYTYFYISLNVLRPTFVNIYNLPLLRSPNIGKIGVRVAPKTSYFSSFMSSCTNIIAVFDNFFSLICNQPRDKQNSARDFLLFKYFWNNLLLTVFIQNTLSKLELLQ